MADEVDPRFIGTDDNDYDDPRAADYGSDSRQSSHHGTFDDTVDDDSSGINHNPSMLAKMEEERDALHDKLLRYRLVIY